mmetsp:Transcript_9029/g.17814  ORF Transcript_9029/g.17814 Transcript_9029/m.17814 type:complete len:278 (+) Transcript_9029:151-984(+)
MDFNADEPLDAQDENCVQQDNGGPKEAIAKARQVEDSEFGVTAAQNSGKSLARPNVVGQLGLFRIQTSPTDELERIKQLRWDQPEYATSILKLNEALIEVAEAGTLQEMVQLVLTCREGELLSWTVAKMFIAACRKGHLSIVRFMLQNGVDKYHPGLRVLLFDLLENSNVSESTLVSIFPVLIQEGGFDVNSMHPRSGYTPLHIACAHTNLAIFKLLVVLGADIHAVANNDNMPLNCVLQAADEAKTVAQITAAGDIAKFLRQLGAQETIQLVSYRG